MHAGIQTRKEVRRVGSAGVTSILTNLGFKRNLQHSDISHRANRGRMWSYSINSPIYTPSQSITAAEQLKKTCIFPPASKTIRKCVVIWIADAYCSLITSLSSVESNEKFDIYPQSRCHVIFDGGYLHGSRNAHTR